MNSPWARASVSPPVKYATEGMAGSARMGRGVHTQDAGGWGLIDPAADGQLLQWALITAHIHSGRGSADLHYGCDFPQSFEERRGVGCVFREPISARDGLWSLTAPVWLGVTARSW